MARRGLTAICALATAALGPRLTAASRARTVEGLQRVLQRGLQRGPDLVEGSSPDFDAHLEANTSFGRVPPEALQLQQDEVEIVFLRHGTSLNNVFKKSKLNVISAGKVLLQEKLGIGGEARWDGHDETDFKRGYEIVCHQQDLCGDYSGRQSSLNWEVGRWSRDSLLHPDLGEEAAVRLGRNLTRALPPGSVSAVFVSPLRRTLQTALAALGPLLTAQNTAVLPWIHERYKSHSDLGNDGGTNAAFLGRYVRHLRRSFSMPATIAGPAQAMQRGLQVLGEGWVDKAGPGEPKLPQPEAPLPLERSGAFPYYPHGGMTYREDDGSFEQRMAVVRYFLTQLPPGRRYVLVSHGGVATALFGRKLHNLGLVTARYFPHRVSHKVADGFFHDVQPAGQRWKMDLPGFRDE